MERKRVYKMDMIFYVENRRNAARKKARVVVLSVLCYNICISDEKRHETYEQL